MTLDLYAERFGPTDREREVPNLQFDGVAHRRHAPKGHLRPGYQADLQQATDDGALTTNARHDGSAAHREGGEGAGFSGHNGSVSEVET